MTKIDGFLLALRRLPAANDHPGLEKARLRTDPVGADYMVQPDATPTYTPKKGDANINNAPNPNQFEIFKP
jgi:hypothetical protein